MLKTRIVTALVLVAIFFPALFLLPSLSWVIFSSVVAVLAAWEWGALMRFGMRARLAIGFGMALVCALISMFYGDALGLGLGGNFSEAAWQFGRWLYIAAALFWLCCVPLWMKFRWPLPKSLCGFAIGLLVILPTWLALIQLRNISALGLLALMASIWLADIAAYFFGRNFGRHKLAPTISPGKTWEGALGGGFAVIVYGFILSSQQQPALLSEHWPWLLVALALLASLSVIGDLFESLLKRQAELKDSSNVLPGHGGILDRIDSLTSTLPLVALFCLVWLRW